MIYKFAVNVEMIFELSFIDDNPNNFLSYILFIIYESSDQKTII